MHAAAALQAFVHVNPYTEADEELIERARVGALLVNELIANSRALVDKRMSIQFVGEGPKVEPYHIGESGRSAPKG